MCYVMASINSFLPIQEGTGTPSPDNVRPIKPAVSIAGGKNLLKIDSTLMRGSTSFLALETTETGVIIGDSSVNGGFLVRVKSNMTYAFSLESDYYGGSLHIRVWKDDIKSGTTTLIVNLTNTKTATFTTDSETEYIRCGFYAYENGLNQTISNIQLEEGSTVTSYEPYQSLDIYGGYLDIINGKLIQEFHQYTFTGEEVLNTQSNSWINYYIPKIGDYYPSAAYPINGMCSHYPYGPYAGGKIGVMYNECACTFDYNIYDATGWQAYLKEQYDNELPMQICYKLATPITHSLSPTQLAQAMSQLGIRVSSMMERKKLILLNSPHVETVSGTMASFKTDMKAPLKSLRVDFFPIQEGSGDPSPTNVRPITGWTGLTVHIKGKNLYDEQNYPFTDHGVVFGSGTYGSSSSYTFKATHDFIPFDGFDGQTITLNKRPGGSNPGIAFYSDTSEASCIGGIKNENGTVGTPITTTVPFGTKYMRFSVPINATDIQIELGSSATTYEPYQGNQISVSFNDNGTIYGGYVDLVTGEIWETWYKGTITSSMHFSAANESYGGWWFTSGSNYNFGTYNYGGVNSSNPSTQIISDVFTVNTRRDNTNATSAQYVIKTWSGSTGADRTQFCLSGTPSDETEFKTWLDEYAPSICYMLKDPRVVGTINPETIKSLLGHNNIWSNANGDIEIKYWKH